MNQYGTTMSVRLSVCPSVCPSMGPQQQTRCCRFASGSGGQKISIDCGSSGVRSSSAGSATLSAYVGS